ncbi:hypothetical protein GCM10009558_073220 [Virgisporangium aurantiacum]
METGQGHRRRPVTIADVAAATGVAPSTVSRALNKPGRVNEVTRQRIQADAPPPPHPPRTRRKINSWWGSRPGMRGCVGGPGARGTGGGGRGSGGTRGRRS